MQHTEDQGVENSAPVIDVAPTAVVSKNKNIMLGAGIGVVIFALIVAVSVGVFRVYKHQATDSFTTAVATVLRLRALKVNNITISYADYVKDLKAITILREYDRKNGGEAANLTDEGLSDQVLVRMVNNALVEETAKEMGITVTDEDVAEVKAEMVAKFGTFEAVEAGLIEHYGWKYSVYEKRVLRPLIAQNKIAEVIAADAPAREAVRAKAQAVLDQIKAGGNFEELAKQHGQDATAKDGGDLPDFKKGDMVPTFEAAAIALKKGQVSPELVETIYGYHIVRLDDVRTEKTKDSAGKTISEQIWHAHHILFLYPSINEKLKGKLEQANIKLFINVHNPFGRLLGRE